MKAMPRIEGEVQCWEHNCEVYVKAEDYAALNEHSALVEMNLTAERDALRAQLLEHAEVCKEGPHPVSSLRATMERVAKILRGSEDEDQGAAYDRALRVIDEAIRTTLTVGDSL